MALVDCAACTGRGEVDIPNPRPCPNCDGRGVRQVDA